MKLTKSQLKQIIKEELSIMTEGGGRPFDPTVPGDWQRQQAMISGEYPEPTSGMEVPEEFIRSGEGDLQSFKERYPNVIGDLGRAGEQELSRKFAEAQFGSSMGGSAAVRSGELERVLLKLLNDGWEHSFFPEEGDFDETN